MKHPPLARHESLQPFSRDHYAGLVQSRHLMKAAVQNDRQRLAALREFVDAWNREIQPHQVDEERLLLSLIDDAAAMQRLLDEHARLSGYASEAARMVEAGRPPEPQLMQVVSRLLRDHIRWEERELFPRIQANTPMHDLEALAQKTAPIEDARPRWSDRARPAWINHAPS